MKFLKTSKSSARRTSDVLEAIAQAPGDGKMTIGDFVDLLGDRSFALAILIFSLPNSLPMPGIPGFSTVTGVPILFISLQVLSGCKTIWLPRSIAKKHFHREFMMKVIHKAVPVVKRLEKLLKPRLTCICETFGERFIGLLIAVMAFILALPIVGTNFLAGVSISLLALALLENDGVFGILGIVFCIVSICLMYSVIALVVSAAIAWIAG